MPSLSFSINVRTKGFNVPEDLQALMSDFSEPFAEIIQAYADHVEEKFARAEGAEQSGVSQSPTVRWEPVTEDYYREKHGPIMRGSRKLFPDWLMVRTGELKGILSDANAFYQDVGETQAVFGAPQDSENQAKIAGNWIKRQALFFDVSDKRAVQSNISDYLNYGANYKNQKQRLMELKEEFSEQRIDL